MWARPAPGVHASWSDQPQGTTALGSGRPSCCAPRDRLVLRILPGLHPAAAPEQLDGGAVTSPAAQMFGSSVRHLVDPQAVLGLQAGRRGQLGVGNHAAADDRESPSPLLPSRQRRGDSPPFALDALRDPAGQDLGPARLMQLRGIRAEPRPTTRAIRRSATSITVTAQPRARPPPRPPGRSVRRRSRSDAAPRRPLPRRERVRDVAQIEHGHRARRAG